MKNKLNTLITFIVNLFTKAEWIKKWTKLKQLSLRFKQWLDMVVYVICHFFIYLWYWICNIWFVFISIKSKFRVFEGWGHYKLASIYANKRHCRSANGNGMIGRKRFYVLPWGPESLAVLSRPELERLKEKGCYPKHANIMFILKHTYYSTK